MTRGKNAAAAANRASAKASMAEDERRAAVLRANALERTIAARDSEIETLKEALAFSRQEHTKVGTYTEADVARIRAEAEEDHRRKVSDGFKFLDDNGVRSMPLEHMSGLIEAFGCELTDVLGEHATHRAHRRHTKKSLRLTEEAMRQGVL